MNIVFNKAASDNLHERSCNVLVVPREPFTPDRKRNFNLQRYKVLYICSNYSSILSRLDHRFHDLKIRCAFAVFQLMTILEEARHSLIIIEHDPPPPCSTRTPKRWWSTWPRQLKQTPRDATILLYSLNLDPYLQKMTELIGVPHL